MKATNILLLTLGTIAVTLCLNRDQPAEFSETASAKKTNLRPMMQDAARDRVLKFQVAEELLLEGKTADARKLAQELHDSLKTQSTSLLLARISMVADDLPGTVKSAQDFFDSEQRGILSSTYLAFDLWKLAEYLESEAHKSLSDKCINRIISKPPTGILPAYYQSMAERYPISTRDEKKLRAAALAVPSPGRRLQSETGSLQSSEHPLVRMEVETSSDLIVLTQAARVPELSRNPSKLIAISERALSLPGLSALERKAWYECLYSAHYRLYPRDRQELLTIRIRQAAEGLYQLSPEKRKAQERQIQLIKKLKSMPNLPENLKKELSKEK